LSAVIVELNCPEHGLERFKIKIIRKYNIPKNTIAVKIKNKPFPGEIDSLIVGRGVSSKDVQVYLRNYLNEVGLWSRVLALKFIIQ